MKLRSVALVGVICIAALGLIGVGAHAAFTTSTTSGQTITAGTGWTTTTTDPTTTTTTTALTDPTDPPPPTVSVTYPVDGTTYGADWTGTITGTASPNSGPGATITGTRVAIEDTSTKLWWSGSSFSVGTQTFVAATGNTTWMLAMPANNLTSGGTYKVVAEATDSLGKVGTSSTVTFTYTPQPTVTITYPVDHTTYGADWTGTITGTASAGPGATISSVSLAIEDTTTKQWWNGTSFSVTSQSFVKATGTTTWYLPL
jgi:hypothetical protein